MPNYYDSLHPEKIYHIYSRATGQEKLFIEQDNYRFFLQKFQKHISPVAETYAWCLLPNHFHFLIGVKQEATIKEHYQSVKPKKAFDYEMVADFLMERFSNWLNSYTKAFNSRYNRKGSLFIDFMKRIEVESDVQFGATVFYIHKNPVHHGLTKQMNNWHWSSFNTFYSSSPTNIKREYVLDWFQGIEGFTSYHDQPVYLKNAAALED